MKLWAVIALCVLTAAFGAALGLISLAAALSHPALDSDMAAFTKAVDDDSRRFYLVCAAAYAALLAPTLYFGRKRRSKRARSQRP